MIPGPNIVYGCPKCGRKVIVKSMTSGNTAGVTIFSDGTRYAPMLPIYPREARCKDCGTFFDFSKENFIKRSYDWMLNEFDCDRAKHLTIEDYKEMIKLKIGNETVNRLNIWQLSNKDSMEFNTESYIENCKKLIEKLKNTNEEDFKITLAELYRNIGEFDKCLSVINFLSDKYDWLKSAFQEQCIKKNIKTFTLPRSS